MTQEAVSIGAAQSELCGSAPERSIIVSRQVEPLLRPALRSYYPDGGAPRLLNQDQVSAGIPFPLGSAACVVFAYPTDGQARALMDSLTRAHPAGRIVSFSERAGKGRVAVFTLAADSASADRPREATSLR